MKLIKTLRAAMAALLTVTMCALCLPSASAATTTGTFAEVHEQVDCTLTVEFAPDHIPMTNNTFRIWKVAELTGKLEYNPETVHGVDLKANGDPFWLNKASTLLGKLQQNSVPHTDSASTGEDGKVTFEIKATEQGLYLVAGDYQWRDGVRYTPTPFLIMVPNSGDMRTWITGVEALCKFSTYTPDPVLPTVERHVLKSWEDDGSEDQRPTEVVVDLLRDGQVYNTVTLTEDGNWRADWTGLDARFEWTVAEREVEGYSVVVEQEGITFHITNTREEDIDPEEPPKTDTPKDPEEPPEPDTDIDEPDVPLTDIPSLPQTGQLWWPVVPMAIGGLLLTALGWKRRRDWSASDEA